MSRSTVLGNPLLLTKAEATARSKGRLAKVNAATYVILDAVNRTNVNKNDSPIRDNGDDSEIVGTQGNGGAGGACDTSPLGEESSAEQGGLGAQENVRRERGSGEQAKQLEQQLERRDYGVGQNDGVREKGGQQERGRHSGIGQGLGLATGIRAQDMAAKNSSGDIQVSLEEDYGYERSGGERVGDERVGEDDALHAGKFSDDGDENSVKKRLGATKGTQRRSGESGNSSICPGGMLSTQETKQTRSITRNGNGGQPHEATDNVVENGKTYTAVTAAVAAEDERGGGGGEVGEEGSISVITSGPGTTSPVLRLSDAGMDGGGEGIDEDQCTISSKDYAEDIAQEAEAVEDDVSGLIASCCCHVVYQQYDSVTLTIAGRVPYCQT